MESRAKGTESAWRSQPATGLKETQALEHYVVIMRDAMTRGSLGPHWLGSQGLQPTLLLPFSLQQKDTNQLQGADIRGRASPKGSHASTGMSSILLYGRRKHLSHPSSCRGDRAQHAQRLQAAAFGCTGAQCSQRCSLPSVMLLKGRIRSERTSR